MDAYTRSLKRIDQIQHASQGVLRLSRQILRMRDSKARELKAQAAIEFLTALQSLEKTIKRFYRDLDQLASQQREKE